MYSSYASVLVGAFAVLGGLFLAGLFLRSYLRYRGKRVITCPATGAGAAVELDAIHAVLTGIGRRRDNRIGSCSEWPERYGCGQQCLSEIASSPAGCLVRNILAGFYAGKDCAICRRPIGPIHWSERNPALLGPDGRTLAWSDLVPQNLHATLETHRPVCFDCHVAETFRRQFPDLVTDRNWR